MRKMTAYLVLFLLSLYALSISNSWDSRATGEGYIHIDLLHSLIDKHQLGLDEQYQHSVPGRNGKWQTYHEFGQSIVVLPVFYFTRKAINDAFAFYAMNAAFTALTAVTISRMLMALNFRALPSFMTALMYGTGTFAWFYAAKSTQAHPIESFFVLYSLYQGLKYSQGRGKRHLVIGAVALGIGLIVRTQSVVALAGLLVFALRRKGPSPDAFYPAKRALAHVGLALAPFVALTLGYNYVRFGSIFENGYSLIAPDVKLFSPFYIPTGLVGLLLSPGKSVFLYAPILVLAAVAARAFYRRVDRTAFLALSGVFAGYLLLISAYAMWDGDACWGPRLLLPALPLMALPLAALLSAFKSRPSALKVLVVAIAVLSVVVQLMPVGASFTPAIVMKFGVDDPEMLPTLKKDFSGPHGSIERLGSFFVLRESMLINQFGVFADTVRRSLDEGYSLTLMEKLVESGRAEVIYYLSRYNSLDLWWLQSRSTANTALAALLALVGAFTAYRLVAALIKADRQPER